MTKELIEEAKKLFLSVPAVPDPTDINVWFKLKKANTLALISIAEQLIGQSQDEFKERLEGHATQKDKIKLVYGSIVTRKGIINGIRNGCVIFIEEPNKSSKTHRVKIKDVIATIEND